ncbi:hypothetical protein PQX77_001395 [Marasmius sp. AFHP31]|nr:hypothetical protein PQX77_001395 [Marasmius sp. AFHP31]
MLSRPAWSDSVGLETIKKVVTRHIPQWPNGLYQYQLDTISKILNREHVLFVSGTGSGKAALFMVPLLAHRELTTRPQPESYPYLTAQENAVAVVVTPTKGLAASIISEAESFGLKGISYCHDVISEYRMKNVDLTRLICECKEWQLLCVDPEHLNSSEWRKIIHHSTFQRHLILFAVDEAHLVNSWGLGFRPAFDSIGACARGHLPETVPILSLTATLPPGQPTVAVCKSLGLVEGEFHLVRRSNERENMYLVTETMKRTPGVSKYAQILDFLKSGRKTVIHVNTIPTAYEIYEFLWQHIPKGCSPLRRMRMYHSLCRDDYNRETFELIDSDPELQIIIATVAFTMGINRKLILDSISWNFPSTLDDYWQAKGRAGRQPGMVCRGIAIVPGKLVKTAQDFLNAHDITKETRTSGRGRSSKKGGKKKTASSLGEMEEGKAKFLAEARCYTAFLNQYYGNPPLDIASGDCREANRTIFCSLCATRYNKPFVLNVGSSTSTWLPVVARITKKTHRRKSKFNLGKKEREVNRRWLIAFREFIWSETEPLDPKFSNYPLAWFFPDTLIDDILDNFLRIDVLADLELILSRHSWRFADKKAPMLFQLLNEFQEYVQTEREEEVMERTRKKAGPKTREHAPGNGTDIGVGDFDEETDASADEVSEDEVVADRTPSPLPQTAPLTITIPPLRTLQHNIARQLAQPQRIRQTQPSAAEYSASFGPPKTKRR